MMKRILDVGCTGLLLLLTAPLILLGSAIVLFSMGKPILFRQIRPGLGGKPFTLYKLRTMRTDVDSSGAPLPDERRITTAGIFLRQTSIDELPQLFNVLRGDMSLVGPRPLLMEYLPLYSAEQKRRHDVRPGVTGWAQVNGRNALTWNEKFALDIWYIENQSIWLDFKILWMTFFRVLASRGVEPETGQSVEKFKGNP